MTAPLSNTSLIEYLTSYRQLDVADDTGERFRMEVALANARILLAATALLAVYLDPRETPYATLSYSLLIGYAVFSGAVLFYLDWRGDVGERFVLFIQGIDILWPTVMSLFTEGPNSPFFVLVSFGLLAAAFRWGMRAALATALLGIGSMSLQALLLLPAHQFQLVQGQFDLIRLVTRSGYMLVMGLLIGVITEGQRQVRTEQRFSAELVRRVVETERSLSKGIHLVLEQFGRLFDADRIHVVARDEQAGEFYLWSLDRSMARRNASSELALREIDAPAGEECLAPIAGTAWFAERNSVETPWQLQAIDSEGYTAASVDPRPPAALVFNSRSVLGLEFTFAKAWTGRMVILEPHLQAPAARELRFAQRLLSEVAPALYNLYLVRRLRSRIGAVERARAGRELHDGALQSLISVEMRLDIVRRRSEAAATPIAAEVGEIQNLLRQEILAVRELMLQMKPIEVGPRDLMDYIAQTVDRFRQDSGIEARFAAAVEEVPLPARICRELARIVQEALINVRKHADATRVLVRFGPGGEGWKLIVEDNGRGFPAPNGGGDGARRPAVIAERVAMMGGKLAIESGSGQGTRLEITVPRAARATHA